MRRIQLLVVAGILALPSCKKDSSGNDPTFKATLISTTPSAFNGTATAMLDGDLLMATITHNIPTPGTTADGIYNIVTGLSVASWFAKPSPLSVVALLDANQKAYALAGQLEVRIYYGTSPSTAGFIKGTLNKQ